MGVFSTDNNYLDAILNLKNVKCIENDIELTATVSHNLKNLPLDEVQISSIFLNIIDNAIDELKKVDMEFKFIHIEIYEENNICNISIKNNGPIIDDVEKIFNKGFSTKGKNRGYGLYSIRQLLEKNNCEINVKSNYEETEFNIKSPINADIGNI